MVYINTNLYPILFYLSIFPYLYTHNYIDVSGRFNSTILLLLTKYKGDFSVPGRLQRRSEVAPAPGSPPPQEGSKGMLLGNPVCTRVIIL
jgi:hypothetical protein